MNYSKEIKTYASEINGKREGIEEIIRNDNGRIKKTSKRLSSKDIGKILLHKSSKNDTMKRLYKRFSHPFDSKLKSFWEKKLKRKKNLW